MREDIELLLKEFNRIKKMGFVKSKRIGPTGIGYTFEELIHKPEENFSVSDFNSIEIKTCRNSSIKKTHLFSASPDGDYLFASNRILYYLGYPDKDMKNVKVFNMTLNSTKYRKIGLFKEAKIYINDNEKKVQLIAKKIEGIPFKINTSWSYDLLKEKLYLKLRYMARIYANVKVINGIEYFHYYKIKFYKLKNFEVFLELMKKGYICVSINIGVFKSGNKKGKIHDRGAGFIIDDKYMYLLFDEIKITG